MLPRRDHNSHTYPTVQLTPTIQQFERGNARCGGVGKINHTWSAYALAQNSLWYGEMRRVRIDEQKYVSFTKMKQIKNSLPYNIFIY
jgi:hypothetical protein